jgi:hypothetical protein
MEDYFRVTTALKRVRALGPCFGSVANCPLLDRKESHGYAVDVRTKGLKPKEEMVLQLAMSLGFKQAHCILHSRLQDAHLGKRNYHLH